MKNIYYFILSIIILIFIGCSSTNEPANEDTNLSLLKKGQSTCDSAITVLFKAAENSGKVILTNNFTESKIREELTKILNNYNGVVEVVFVDSKSIMTHIEPAEFKYAEGSDISTQEHQIQMLATQKNAMSRIFKLVENYYAIVLAAPIINNGKYEGSINIVVRPDLFIDFHTNSFIKGKVDDFWVMETNGNILYDTDPTQTGRNLFTDTLYQPYPELLLAGNKIVNGTSGQTNYSFLDKSKQKTVTKDVWWETSTYYGRIWKYSVVKERN